MADREFKLRLGIPKEFPREVRCPPLLSSCDLVWIALIADSRVKHPATMPMASKIAAASRVVGMKVSRTVNSTADHWSL